MKREVAYVKRIAVAAGFDAVQLEKVIRLRQLLIEFRKHSFLRERLVLKGGTAVNLFYLELARLSVDIDLNYVGQLDPEEMQRERPEIVKATEQITEALGYKVQKSADAYALDEWFLAYQNHIRSPDQIQVPNGNPTASNLFEIVAYLRQAEGVRFKVRSTRAA